MNPPGRGGEDDANLITFAELGEGHQTYRQVDQAMPLRTSTGGGSQAANIVARCVTAGHGRRYDADTDDFVVSTLQGHGPGSGYRVGADEAAGGQLVPVTIRTSMTRANGDPISVGIVPTLDGQSTPAVGYNIIGLGQTSKNHAYEAPGNGCLQSKGLCPTGNEAATVIAYQQQGSNVGPMGTLRKGDGGLTSGVPFVAHSLRAEGADASEDGTGRGTPLIAFHPTQDPITSEDVSHAMGCGNDHGTATVAIAFKESQSGTREGGMDATLDANKGSRRQEGVREGMSVRRLTPTECERLQGFEDGWTLPDDGKPPLSDSARYRLLGNAITRYVARWLGRRIKAILQPEERP